MGDTEKAETALSLKWRCRSLVLSPELSGSTDLLVLRSGGTHDHRLANGASAPKLR